MNPRSRYVLRKRELLSDISNESLADILEGIYAHQYILPERRRALILGASRPSRHLERVFLDVRRACKERGIPLVE